MAEAIDRAALGVLGAAGYYLFFLNAWRSIPLACAAAFACTALSLRLLRGLPFARRASAAQARAALLRLASLDDAAGEAALSALVRARWPAQAFRLAPILKHPEASLSPGDVLNAWKANRDAGRLLIAATCPCEPRAALFARTLQEPVVAVVDSRGLTRLLRALPAGSLPRPPARGPRYRLAMLGARLAGARFSPRSALTALALLACYMRTGSAWYLFPALALLARAGAALIHRGVGRSPFDRD